MTISTKTILNYALYPNQGIFKVAKVERIPGESYSLRRILDGPFSLFVQLKKLNCHKTEDFVGYDDLFLDIFIDGEFANTLKFRLKEKGSTQIDINGGFHIKDRISFHLYEYDMFDPNDFLGGPTIYARNFKRVSKGNSVGFTSHGARYNLEFDCHWVYHPPPTAHDLVEDFRKRRSRSVWSKIQRDVVAEQLKIRIDKPERIDQGPSSFCGPAAVLFELARHMPRRYVKMVIDLYEKGVWASANDTIKAPKGLLDTEIYVVTDNHGNPRSADEADWIPLTSMRDSSNRLFSLDKPEDTHSNIEAGAIIFDVSKWCTELLGWRETDIYTTTLFGAAGFRLPFISFDRQFRYFSGGAIDGLKEAIRTLKKGGAAMIQLNSGFLKAEPQGPLSVSVASSKLYSNHFVSLHKSTANVTRDGWVELDLYTWGNVKKIRISKNDFEKEVFAFVLTWPRLPI